MPKIKTNRAAAKRFKKTGTDDSMDGREVLDYYRTSSSWNFALEMASSMQE